MKVLVTRPEVDASGFADLLTKNGMTPIPGPVIRIEFNQHPLPDLADVTHLAFTSANGVRAFASKTADRHWPVFAVGPATASAATTEGFPIGGVAQNSVSSMADQIVANTNETDTVLHTAGTHRAGDLQNLVQQAGRQCRRIVLYEAREVDTLPAEVCRQLRHQEIDAVTFFSPRSARLFLDLMRNHGLEDELSGLKLACLSDSVADVFRPHFDDNIVVAKRPDQSAMIDILATGRT